MNPVFFINTDFPPVRIILGQLETLSIDLKALARKLLYKTGKTWPMGKNDRPSGKSFEDNLALSGVKMGQIGVMYKGRTWKLLHALSLRDKERINPVEAAALVEGGKLCMDQGVNLMTEGNDGPAAAEVIDALIATTNSLLEKVKMHLDDEQRGRIPSDESIWLAKRIQEVEEESSYLSTWSDWMHTSPLERKYNA